MLGSTELFSGSATRYGSIQYWVANVISPRQGFPVPEPSKLPAGTIAAFVTDPGHVGADELARRVSAAQTERVPAQEALHRGGLTYFIIGDSSHQQNAALAPMQQQQRLPSIGAFYQGIEVSYWFGLPRRAWLSGEVSDVKQLRVSTVAESLALTRAANLSMGAATSLAEGLAWELNLGAKIGSGISAASILVQAKAERVPIVYIDATNSVAMLARLQVSADVKNDVIHAGQNGGAVLMPERELKRGSWSGVGYLILDTQTMLGAWMIEGGLAGGKLLRCLIQAIGLQLICGTRFAALLKPLLAVYQANQAIAFYAANPSQFFIDAGSAVAVGALTFLAGPLVGAIAAVILAISVIMAAYELYRWIKELMEGLETLTDEERAQMGVDIVADALCAYRPNCFTGFGGGDLLGDSGGSGGFGGDGSGAGGPLTGFPVDIGYGNKWLREEDYQANTDFPLTFQRHYHSNLVNGHPMGNKWTSSAHYTLVLGDAEAGQLPDAVLAMRADGAYLQFNRRDNGYETDSNIFYQLTKQGSGNQITGWTLVTSENITERYNASGKIISRTDREGRSHTFTLNAKNWVTAVTDHFGRRLQLRYTDGGLVDQVTLPDNRLLKYRHDDKDRLIEAEYPDQTKRVYHYEDARHPSHMTGISDERGARWASYEYDGTGRVKASELAGGAAKYQFNRFGQSRVQVIDPLGTAREYHYQMFNERPYLLRVDQSCTSCGGGIASNRYSGTGSVIEETDFRGNKTSYQRNARGLAESITEAVGTPEQRTITQTWHPTLRMPTERKEPVTGGTRTTNWVYNPNGTLKETRITANNSAGVAETRVWAYTYNSAGQVLTEDGPRTDVSDLMTYTYNADGTKASMTDALGFVSTYNTYDANGQLTKMTDPNGLVVEYRYDQRDRLVETKSKASAAATVSEVTTYDYMPTGNLSKVTLPDASFLSYRYDSADRLVEVQDQQGQKLKYTLNANGDRTQEDTFGSSNAIVQSMSRVIDELGRVKQTISANANEITGYTYDANDNLKISTDPNQLAVTNNYDALDRLIQVIDPNQVPVGFKYDPQDNLIEVSDPRSLKTNYGYSGFDELKKLTSPDTGVTDYQYDLAGNLRSRKDARNITATYTYDAANRIRTIQHPATPTGANNSAATANSPSVIPANAGTQAPQSSTLAQTASAETLNFSYDEPTGGPGAKGRLTSVIDGSGSTKYQYDTFGRVTSKSQTVGSNTAKTQTISHLATGQRNEHTLPSGAVVKYGYRADGRVVSIQVNGVTIVSELDYFPFGEVKSWKYNTADRYLRVFDSNGRVKEHTSASATRAIGFDPGSRITSITDGTASANQLTYGYDTLDRLKSAENAATVAGPLAQLKLGWTFDATGNRKTETRAIGAATPVPTAYTIDAASNKLGQVGSLARTYDAVGNTLADGAIASVYSARNRLIGVTKVGVLANYQHNAFGERVSKTVAGVHTQFVYDDDGHLLGEYRAAESTEYVWLGDVPVAVIKPQSFVASHSGKAAGSSAVFFLQPDHLDTPRVLVNASNLPVWKWDSAPIGDTLANEQPSASLAAFQFNLRFPGQQFDTETGAHYNHFRDYEAGTGNYLQSDPAGLIFDYQTYRYGSESPVQYSDPLGLGLIVRNSGGSIVYRDKSYPKPCPTGTPAQKGVAGENAMHALAASGVIPGVGASTGRTTIPPPSGKTGNSVTDGTSGTIGLESKCGPCARPTKNQKQNKGNIGAAGLTDLFTFRFR